MRRAVPWIGGIAVGGALIAWSGSWAASASGDLFRDPNE